CFCVQALRRCPFRAPHPPRSLPRSMETPMRYGRIIFILALSLLASCGQTTTTTDANPEQTTTSSSAQQTPAIDATVFCAEVARRVTPAQCDTYVQLAQS